MSPTQQDQMEQTTSCGKKAIPPLTLLLLLLLNASFMLVGTGGALLLRLYFVHGGSRLWLSSFLQSAGCPIILIPIFLSSFLNGTRPFRLPPRIVVASAILGLFSGLINYIDGYGASSLPLSTSSILVSSQLPFTALFAFLINGQRFTAYSINAVVLLTIGPVVLGLSSGKDRPVGETNAKYYLGFGMTLLSALLVGLTLPLMERLFKMAKEGLCYATVMEIQFVTGFFSNVFCLVGMAANKDFQAIAGEAREFGLGEVKYCIVLICAACLFQLAALGTSGVIFCFSSLFTGILNAVLPPLSAVLGVVFFHEKFNGSKGIALTLCLWGFTSYLYGEKRPSKKLQKLEVENATMAQINIVYG